MPAAYSTRDVARLLKVPEGRVRALARAGVAGWSAQGRFRFDFRDVLVLKTANRLVAEGIAPRAVEQALATMKSVIPAEQPLSGLRFTAEGGRVLASDGETTWEAGSGQVTLTFGQTAAPGQPVLLPGIDEVAEVTEPIELPRPHSLGDAHAWFDLGASLEDQNPQRAYECYLRALECDPEHPEATINIGRLCSAAGDLSRAAAYFRQAIRLDPSQPIAHFNLGVTLHDLDDVHGAIVAYRTALIHDPHFADAHYNLSSLLEQQGDAKAALQHMNAYRAAQETNG